MMLRYAVPLAVFAAVGALLWRGLALDPSLVPSPLVGKPAPDFELPLLGAPETTMSRNDLLGRPYLLNVWASWCYPCRIEHPVVERFAKSGALPVYGLNYRDQPADAQRWLAQYGDPYEANLADESGRVAIDFGVYGAPETFLIDARGIIRYKHVGPLTDALLRDEILPLAAGG